MSAGSFTGILQVSEKRPKAHFYSPNLARFVQPDTIIPERYRAQTRNRYTYVSNNPINKIDPTGHCEFDPETGDISRFDCSADEFDQMSIKERKRWVIQFMKQSGFRDWFNNILGIIEGFELYGEGESGSWISIVDSYILVAIQDGWALARDNVMEREFPTAGERVNAELWAKFFNADRNDEAGMISIWGKAEQAATDFGVLQAANRGVNADLYESLFLGFGDAYRSWVAGFEEHTNAHTNMMSECQSGNSLACESLTASSQIAIYDDLADPRSMIGGHHAVYWFSIALRTFVESFECSRNCSLYIN